MQKINYKKLDLTEKSNEINYIKKLKEKNYFIIGIEVFDLDISKECNINLDPQHSGGNYKKTAIEAVFNLKEQIKLLSKKYDNIMMLTIKSDLDSIGSMALLTLYLKNILDINGDLILRLKAISFSDQHGIDEEWKPNIKYDNFVIPSYTKYGLPISLVLLISDLNLNINLKVKSMIEYLINGDFLNREKYENINKLKNPKSITNIEIIIPNTLVYVESTFRGAIGYGYKKAPIVLAKNDKYTFGKKSNRSYGIKYTIAQYNEKYADFNTLNNQLLELENGWGGSKVILGSPQTNPSELTKHQIIELIKHVTYS